MTPEHKRLFFGKLWFWRLNQTIKAPFRAIKQWWINFD